MDLTVFLALWIILNIWGIHNCRLFITLSKMPGLKA